MFYTFGFCLISKKPDLQGSLRWQNSQQLVLLRQSSDLGLSKYASENGQKVGINFLATQESWRLSLFFFVEHFFLVVRVLRVKGRKYSITYCVTIKLRTLVLLFHLKCENNQTNKNVDEEEGEDDNKNNEINWNPYFVVQ